MERKRYGKKGDQPFVVDINDIDEESGLHLEIRRSFETFLPEEGKTFSEPVNADLHVIRFGEDIYIKGTVKTTVDMECSRCLAGYTEGIEAQIDAHFFPKEEIDEEDGGEYNFYEGETVDLYQALHDGLGLAAPLKPLCKEDCKGLCPKCGADLNTVECGCSKKEIDGRLAVLKNLKLDK